MDFKSALNYILNPRNLIYKTMTSNFSINRLFEESLAINFTINDGNFTTNGQSFVIQHASAIQLLTTLNDWNHVVYNEDDDNDFTVEYRWSFDTVIWSNYVPMFSDFDNFPNPNTAANVWLQIKYTANITTVGKILQLKELNINGTRTVPEFFQPIIISDQAQVYKNADTYKVFQLEDFKVYLNKGNINDLEIHFRYTQTQGRSYSPWALMTKENIAKARFDRLKFCNFEFGFRNIGSAELSLYDLELIGEFINVTANYKTMNKFGLKTQCNPLAVAAAPTGACTDPETGTATDCCTACASSESITPWNDQLELTDGCGEEKYVNLNNKDLWKKQILVYNELNKFINKANSWKVSYVLTDNDGKGTDHILHEHTLQNYIMHKDIQVVVPNNQFPVDNVNFTNLDFDLIQTFEVHIIKDHFKSAFGVEFRPSKKDVLYICDLNQMWEVEQMFPHRGFMNAIVYWRVILKKYNDRKNRTAANTQQGQDAKAFIDSLTKYTTLDGLFGLDVKDEINKGTKDIKTAATSTQQYTYTSEMNLRKAIAKNTIITTDPIQNSSLMVSKSCYEIAVKSKGLKVVEYNPTDQRLGKADNRAISFWFKTSAYDADWDYTVLSNYDTTNSLGYKVNIFSGALEFRLNDNTHIIPLPGFEANKWYCFLINVDQIQQQLEIVVYTRQAEDGSTLSDPQLLLFTKKILPLVPDEFIHTQNMFIGGCDTMETKGNRNYWYMTNIRIFKEVIAKDKRQIVLNENVISDSHLAILVDNAEEQLILPKYGNL
jgi:hypothetical protein